MMRQRVGLAVVGFAIAFGVTLRFASHAKENQPLAAPSALAQQPVIPNPHQPKVTAFPTTDILVNPSINPFSDSQTLSMGNSDLQSKVVSRGDKEDKEEKVLHTLAKQLRRSNATSSQLYTQTPSQDIPPSKDGERFRRVMQDAIAQKLAQRPMGEIMQAIAQQFLGAAYKADLLDQSTQETLVVNLHQFDCVLLVESVLAIARGVAVQDYSYATFINHLRDQRYRNGQINGYCSRLHYFIEWIDDNQKRGTVQNIAQNLGGVSLNKTLNYMTMHRQSSPRMAKDDMAYQCMVEQEAQLDDVAINYIPTKQIRSIYPKLQPGDIIAVTTNIPGLDVTHTGFVYRQPNGNIGLIHASPAGQVTIARDLERYVSRVKNAIGILVTRPLDPRQTPHFSN